MDLRLTDRVFVVTGGARGLGRATADCLVAEGARVVLSGRSAESLEAAVADARRRGHARSRPTTPTRPRRGRLVDGRAERWGRLDGALISVGGPPKGPVTDMTDEQWTTRLRVGLPRRGPAGPRDRLRARRGRVARPGAVLGVRAPLADLAISNGLRPGLAMVAKTLADEVGPAGCGSTGCCPGRVATDRVAELDALSGDAGRGAGRRRGDDPAGPLRRAGGVRPGRGLPAVAGGVVRHRRHAAGRRRDAPLALSAVRIRPGGRLPSRAAHRSATAARLVAHQVAEAEERQRAEEPPLQAVEEVRAVAEVGQLGGRQRLRRRSGARTRASTKPCQDARWSMRRADLGAADRPGRAVVDLGRCRRRRRRGPSPSTSTSPAGGAGTSSGVVPRVVGREPAAVDQQAGAVGR